MSEVEEEALEQLSVPAELAQKVLQVLEKRCQGRDLRDLRGSRVYARHSLGGREEQEGGGDAAVSAGGDTGPEGATAEAAEGELRAAPGPAQGPRVEPESDSELFRELLEREGLLLPEASEEQSQGNVLPQVGPRGRLRAGGGCGAGAPVGAGPWVVAPELPEVSALS